MKKLFFIFFMLTLLQEVYSQGDGKPILDMHLHAFIKDSSSELTAYEVNTFAAIERFNMFAVTSGKHWQVLKWQKLKPDRILPGLTYSGLTNSGINLDSVQKWHKEGSLKVLGELGIQYRGIKPSDSIMQPVWELAENLGLPVAIHMGPGPEGIAYTKGSGYRAANSNPLLLEDMLIQYPKLKVYVMHAGWPFISEMIAVLQAHPQVYVDIGVIDWDIPKEEFYFYLKRLINAGYGKRILYGSDQVMWPEMIEVAIGRIESADFLSEEQKRDIFYNNAARFLELTDEQIEKHHKLKATNKR